MKKVVNIVFAIMFVLGLFAFTAPINALAKTDPAGGTGSVAGGTWIVTTGTGTEVDVSQSAATAPDWLQLFGKGITLEAGSKICHPFRGGQFGWVGQIRQLKDGKWVKLVTTGEWVPSTEGQYMACAQAPAAGTYALFGYYIAPEVVEVPNPCSKVTWENTISLDGTIFFDGTVTGVPTDTTISIVILSSTPSGTSGSTSDTTSATGSYFVNSGITDPGDLSVLVVQYTESATNCTTTKTFTWID